MELSTYIAMMLIGVSMILVLRHYLQKGRYSSGLLAKEVIIIAFILMGSFAIDLFVFQGKVLVGFFAGAETMNSLLTILNDAGPENAIYMVFTVLAIIIPMIGALLYLIRKDTPA